MKKWLLVLLKIIIASVAMYFAFRNVNFKDLEKIKWGFSVWWLLPAILFYNTSQFISAYRLQQFYLLLDGPELEFKYNLRLYYAGMFYNLFLPGSVGGDVYKVLALKKTKGFDYLPLTKATLLDRITGLFVLLSVGTIFMNITPLPILPPMLVKVAGWLIIPGFFIYWLIVRTWFRPFHTVLFKAAGISIIMQLLQLLAFICILLFLYTPVESLLKFGSLFFTGSVVAGLPVSIGGIGTRELTMTTGAGYLALSQTIAFSASLLFYITAALSAVTGWVIGRKGV